MKSKINTPSKGLTKNQFAYLRKNLPSCGAAIAYDLQDKTMFVCQTNIKGPGNLNQEYYAYIGWMPYDSIENMDNAFIEALYEVKQKSLEQPAFFIL